MTEAKMYLISEVLNMSDDEFSRFLQLVEEEFSAGHLPAFNLTTSAESACT